MVQQNEQTFNPIQFETEREEIFNRTENDYSAQKYQYYSDDFSSGAWDGIQGNQPTDAQIMSADYRNGYLSGTQEKLEKRLIDLQQFAA